MVDRPSDESPDAPRYLDDLWDATEASDDKIDDAFDDAASPSEAIDNAFDDTADSGEPAPPTVSEGTEVAATRHRPNYTVRRVLVAGFLAVAAGVAAVVAYTMFGDGAEPLTLPAPTWDAVVEVSSADGSIAVLAPDGAELDTFAAAGRRPAVERVLAQGPHLALVREGGISLVDTVRGRTVAVETDPESTTTALSDTAGFALMSAPDNGGALLIIDGATGQQLDVARLADLRDPLLLATSVRSDPAGRSFAVGDGRNFQTVVVGFDDEPTTGAVFFPGVPLAISADLVVTAANVGPSAELGLFDRTGERRQAITTDRPVGGVIDGERFVYVTEAGRVLSARTGEPDELGVVAVPGSDDVRRVAPVADGARMVVSGDRFVAVVDLDGEVLHQSSLTTTDALPEPAFAWRCLPVITDGIASIVDLTDGSIVAEGRLDVGATGPDSVAADGCAVAAGRRIVSAAGAIDLTGTPRAVALAPDGRAAAVTSASGTTRLLTWGQSDSGNTSDTDETDLGTRRGLFAFVDRTP